MAYCHIGTTPDGPSSFHLPRAIGIKRTLEMTLLGDRYTARQMSDMGLVNFVVAPGDLEQESDNLVQRLPHGATHVYGMAKKLMYRSLENEFESQLQLEFQKVQFEYQEMLSQLDSLKEKGLIIMTKLFKISAFALAISFRL